ncbi:putative homoserine kinase [Leptomonas pyrrhocoris]|uniref:Putative homoserine kinase n=1 Tax=Leptomonas pyrrhocoris TaxID=157538 RepID=A0A0M9G6Q7_LEPPY|nr:putative homoserine kinase [Leptomonas pyrrhocoris]XP_015661866.1 putative homoserine kinase [Leptomonas pyrrhocoris]XP_015661867.1 putative homoserine kinase [Leptomonas pyrrhocoris]KPA83426.1 putative homoserine kinase [Leptomonas pyrrhocoris]KPA83427.1 putative homoserine kinase [Leptomonas pyrrhocoris]KPA83428.1 putative homoserine kinase [Leptomonas pyrrhocoris]|eukprot:XP_015661865.1 putative homoserine kinase [Leptomonas pyrrhocoris]
MSAESAPTLPTKVSLRVPATTANLGPAYDTLGMAMSIFIELTVEVSDEFSMEVTGEGSEHISRGADNMIVETCRIAFEYAKKPMPPLKFTMHNNIPYRCGCGSSSAAAAAGFVAGMTLSGLTMETQSTEALLSVISKIEGHPDNAAPAIYGGIQLGYKRDDGSVMTYRVPTPPNLSIVLFVPHKLMKASTHVTRELVPQTVSLSDAIHNISGTAILTLALATGELRLLKDASDCLHEQQRSSTLYPHYNACAKAAREAGAVYAFLSGAGPTVCALVTGRRGDLLVQPEEERKAERVAEAMVRAAGAAGVAGRAIITVPSDLGVHLSGTTCIRPDIQYTSI